MNITDKSKGRFWSKVNKTDTCWFWTGATNTQGYGNFKIDNATCKAHRVAYELLVGPIPEGLQLDHLCSVKNCVNPEHLEAVTQRENLFRATNTVTFKNSTKTHCVNGHEFTAENTYKRPNSEYRNCVICRSEKSIERYKRSKA